MSHDEEILAPVNPDEVRAEVLRELIAVIRLCTPMMKTREQVRGAEWAEHMAEAEITNPGYLRNVVASGDAIGLSGSGS